MIEYPQMINSSKAPRKSCFAFEKFDGSNIRVKWTAKQGFCLFGSRYQLLDASHPHLGQVVSVFKQTHAEPMDEYFRKNFRNEKEINVFGEFFGANSFAGIHIPEEPKKFVMFDIAFIKKGRNEFLLPQWFHLEFSGLVETAPLVYQGNLNEELITDVRAGKYPVGEGVVCKGTEKSGAFRGGVWMCKIKTQSYFDRLRQKFGENWTKYGE